ncbi:hypothetical protein [Flavobacterium weaverense]|uniref:Uncharacterized protein n=1 Tax=Flavobacterium weaverense TaxID=271156 RepID=A0A3L9ZJZ3_9FLAO|nr:hypothetical protein [Flavobacterium weaverense]RMA72550.1 hypothetical protein BC961_2953 [Flavobacterium weaverense]
MKKIFIVYILVCFISLATIFLHIKYNITFVGFWSDRILFWIWLSLTCIIIILFWKKKLVKVYFALLIFTIILSIIPMGVPFWGIYLSITGKGLRFEKEITPEYRVQIATYSIMARYAPLQVIRNLGVFEKEISSSDSELKVNDSLSISNWDIKNVWYISENDKEITLKITDGTNTLIKNFQKKEDN